MPQILACSEVEVLAGLVQEEVMSLAPFSMFSFPRYAPMWAQAMATLTLNLKGFSTILFSSFSPYHISGRM
ncbi:MAG: hypothetical protein A4E30_01055 [Methanomassiliicoccales archaeon PtaB.Bin215]|nr:MAG: hypothetical protein A4E30_01055 [Methanomassiliicoccales archaeon PtaB.Bin215]